MDSRLIDSHAVSIITSPNKQFYHMTVVDSSDGEALYDRNDVGNVCNRSNQFTCDNVKNSCDASMISFSDGQEEEFLKSRFTKSDSLESFTFTPRNSGNSVSGSAPDESISYSDVSFESLSVGSEIVFDAEASVGPSTSVSSENLPDSRKDVARAVSSADLFSQIYVQKIPHRSESYLNTCVEKSRLSPRKCFRKSKSVQNNSSGFAKAFGCRLQSDTRAQMQDNSRRNISENLNKSKRNGVWKSPSLTDNLVDGTKSWKLRAGTRDIESSASENGVRTSDSAKVTSTGQESTNIEQTWDEYQVPLYEAISDDSTEEKLDASCLQGDWQPLTDEFGNFSDFGDETKICHQKTRHSHVQDSDTDTEELHCIMMDSSKALRLATASLADMIKRGNQTGQNSSVKELLATCETNITCLKNLLEVVDQRDWDVHDINHLSELVAQWEDVKSQLYRLTSCHDISNLKPASSFIIDLSSTDDDVTICKETDFCSTEVNVDENVPTVSATCHSQSNGIFIPRRFNIFGSKLYNLLDESGLALQSAVTSIQPLFFVLLILFIAYLFVYRRCFIDVMDIRFEPQLRYVIGPPPA